MKAIKIIFLACALAFIPGLQAVCQITDAKTGNRVEASKIYSEAIEIHRNAELQQNRNLDLKAAALFKKAIETDPGHVPSYVQLGWIYATRMGGNFWEDNYLDSALYFAEKAVSIDKYDGSGYHLTGFLCLRKGLFDKALDNFNRAISLGGDKTNLYMNLSSLYYQMGQYKNAAEALMVQYRMQEPEGVTDQTMNQLFNIFHSTGCFSECNTINDRLLKQHGDSTEWSERLMYLTLTSGDYPKILQMASELHTKDPDNLGIISYLGFANFFGRNFTESLKNFELLDEMIKQRGGSYNNFVIGFLLHQNGNIEIANDILNRCIEDVTRIKKANLYPESNLPDLQLAICQAAKGDKAKAMEHLKNNKSCNCLVINHMKNNPCFDSIRNDPEFQSILKHTESRYADAHQQMEEYLKEIAVFN